MPPQRRPTPVPGQAPAPPQARRRLVELDNETAMYHNNTIDERGLLRRIKWRVATLVSRTQDRRSWYAMRQCVAMSIQETDLPFYRLEQLFYMVALDHINDLIREDEARNSVDAAAALVNNIPRTCDRYW